MDLSGLSLGLLRCWNGGPGLLISVSGHHGFRVETVLLEDFQEFEAL